MKSGPWRDMSRETSILSGDLCNYNAENSQNILRDAELIK